jgi:hypothetical protein
MKTCHIESRKEDILHTGNGRKASWFGHILRRNCILKQVNEGEIEVTERRGRRRTQLLEKKKKKRGYWKLKEEALDGTLWRTGFGRGYEPVVR